MNRASLTMFCDGCPSDWLEPGYGDRWHTLAFVGFPYPETFESFVEDLSREKPFSKLKKWKLENRRSKYQHRFVQACANTISPNMPWINAVSFQEATLTENRQSLLELHGRYLERRIGFAERIDHKGRTVLIHEFLHAEHEFLHCEGYEKIEAPETQVLVLVAMALMVLDQYYFYASKAVELGYSELHMSLHSDLLSGDNSESKRGLRMLSDLIHHQYSVPISIIPVDADSNEPAHLLADNLAGWLNRCISAPRNDVFTDCAHKYLCTSPQGWKKLIVENGSMQLANVTPMDISPRQPLRS